MSADQKLDMTIPPWRKFRWHLLVYFILLAVVPVLVGGYFSRTQMHQQTTEQVFNQLEAVSELKYAQIMEWLRTSNLAVDMLLSNPAAYDQLASFSQSPDGDMLIAINDWLSHAISAAQETNSFFLEFILYDTDGNILAASDTSWINKVVRSQPYFAPSLAADRYTQPPYYDLRSNELTIVITQALSNQAETVGVLAARLDVTALGRIMTERTGLGETGETYLVSKSNNYLLTPSRAEGYVMTRAYHSEGIDNALNRQDGSGTYENYYDPPETVLGVHRWIPELQAALVAEISQEEAFTLLDQTLTVNTTVVVVSAVVAALIGLVIAMRIANPITALTRVATKVAGGDLEQQVRVRQKNEVGLLATAFNRMTVSLRQNMVELERNEARFRNIIESLPLGMNVYRLLGDDSLVLTNANPAAERILEMDFMQFVGQPFERIFPSLADTETPSRYREAARDGTPWYTERIYNDRIFEIYAFQTSPGTMVSAFSDITARKQAEQERAELQQEVIDAQKRAIQELSSPIIPLMEEIIVMPLIGTIDTQRARDVTRSLLAGITEHRARIVILDVTGVPVIDTGIAQHLDKAIQAAQLKGTDTIITGITDAVAEAVVDLGIDWGGLKTMRDLQTGLVVALRSMGMKLDKGR